MFSDLGLYYLAEVLKGECKVAHLSILNCVNLTDEGINHLLDVVTGHNMNIF
jgi:hypothetical protein